MKSAIALLSCALFLSLSACNSSSNNNNNSGGGYVDPRVALANSLTNSFVAEYGVNFSFSLVKYGQDNPNYMVFSYYVDGQPVVGAFDLSNYNSGLSFSQNMETYYTTSFWFLSSNGNGTYSCGYGCQDGGYYDTSSSMVFEETSSVGKDIEKAQAVIEQMKVSVIGDGLVAKLGLSEERAYEVARLASNWQTLSKSRSMTSRDADRFTQEVMGANMTDIEAAVKDSASGSAASMNDLIEKAAEKNGTSPEQMGEIVKKLFVAQ